MTFIPDKKIYVGEHPIQSIVLKEVLISTIALEDKTIQQLQE